jgi:hypothetical protein
MSEARQRAYLEALDIPVWVRKSAAEQVPGFDSPALRLGPGSGQVLLICAAVDEPAMRIATDVARSLKSEPVWAWPDHGAAGNDISATVKEHLFTTIVLFGKDLATQLFNVAIPESLGSARLLQAPSIGELARSPRARRSLWQAISASHLTGRAGA